MVDGTWLVDGWYIMVMVVDGDGFGIMWLDGYSWLMMISVIG
jgi:hypothetical protein